MAAAGKVRINNQRIEKPSAPVRPGDILTLTAGGKVMVVRVLGLGERRGPATEACKLYEAVEDA